MIVSIAAAGFVYGTFSRYTLLPMRMYLARTLGAADVLQYGVSTVQSVNV